MLTLTLFFFKAMFILKLLIKPLLFLPDSAHLVINGVCYFQEIRFGTSVVYVYSLRGYSLKNINTSTYFMFYMITKN